MDNPSNDCEQMKNWFQDGEVSFNFEDVISIGKPLCEADTYKKKEIHFYDIDSDDIDFGLKEKESGNQFSPQEREYARMMIKLGFTVYREPKIKDCNHLPDFYIYDPDCNFGVLVEITKSTENCLSKRKQRQIKSLNEISKLYGIPFVLLCQEDLEMLSE